jgi:serine/threonine protein kinase/WD40 repeat protein
MNKERDSSETNLPDAIRIDEICDEFEAARQAGKSIAIEDFLTRVPEALVPRLIEELVGLEIDYRRNDGLPVDLEAIRKRFPQLRGKYAERTLQWQRNGKHNNGREVDRTGNTLRYVGDYELLSVVARGGMGIVYRARQISLGRIVAVKTILDGQLATPEQVTRFQSEACAAANLDHPDIVPIYEVGEHQNCHFYSMAYVDGTNLADRLKGGPSEPHSVVAVMARVCRAVQYAHENGVVHRDLKPQNVLIDSRGRPRITDFGLAKRIAEDSAATRYGEVMGTPSYMPPEQASGKLELIGPLSDVYSLGAILFALLSGRPPFQAPTAVETLRQVVEQEPLLLRQLSPSVPIDLETIVAKCLEKAPPRRYSSAAALADDLDRWSRGEPILARPVSVWERGWRWCSRNPYTAIPLSTVALLLCAVAIGSTIAASSFKRISDRAEAASKLADQRALDTRLELARSRIGQSRMLRMSARKGQHFEAIAAVREARDILTDLEKHGLEVLEADWTTLRNEAASAQLVPDLLTVARWPRSNDNFWLAVADMEHQRYFLLRPDQPVAELRRIGTGELLDVIRTAPEGRFSFGMFSRQGNHLALFSTPDNRTHFYDVSASPRLIRSDDAPHFGMISDDGTVYVGGVGDTTTRVVRIADGSQLDTTNVGKPLFGLPLHPSAPRVAISANGIGVYDYDQKKLLWSRTVDDSILGSAWSHDGRLLTFTEPGKLHTVDGETGQSVQLIEQFDEPNGLIPLVALQAGLIGSADWSRSFRWHDVHTGRLRLKDSVGFFDVSRVLDDRGRIGVGYAGKDYIILEPRRSRVTEFAPQSYTVMEASPSGSLLAVARKWGGVSLFHLPSCSQIIDIPDHLGDLPLGFEPDESALYLYGKGEVKRVSIQWEGQDHSQLVFRDPTTVFAHGARDVWGADRLLKTIAVPNYDNAQIFQLKETQGRTMATAYGTSSQHDVRAAEVSANGKWVALGSHVNGKIAVYAAIDGHWLADLCQGGGWATFSPDDQWVAIGKFAGGGQLFRTDNWEPVGDLPGNSFAFSEDGKLLAVDDGPGTISFLDTSGLREIGRLMIQDPVRIAPKALTRDGTGLVAVTLEDSRCLYFDLAGLRDDLRELGLDWNWPSEPVYAPPETKIPRARIEPPAN